MLQNTRKRAKSALCKQLGLQIDWLQQIAMTFREERKNGTSHKLF
jgi:hypothetical protein